MQPQAVSSNGYGYYAKPGGGGYAFFNPQGDSISAETYAMGTGTNFANLVHSMAAGGDTGAQALINQQGGNLGLQETQQGVGKSFYWGGTGSADPYAQNILSGGGGSGGSGSGAPTSDPQAVSYYNDVIDQLQRELSSAQGQHDTGLANIDNGYQRSLDRVNQQEGNDLSNYATQDVNNNTNKETTLNNIGNDAGNTYSSIMQMLGHSGAGVSSAAQFTAPELVSQNATTQRTGAFNTYGQNQNAIDTARKQTQDSYNNSISDLGLQRDQAKQTFLTNLLNTEGGLNQQIRDATINRAEAGGANYQTAANQAGSFKTAADNIQGQLDQIFQQYATPTFTAKAVTAAPANISQYTFDPTKVATQQQSGGSTDASLLPYLQQIKQNQQQNNNPLVGGGVPSSATAITAAA